MKTPFCTKRECCVYSERKSRSVCGKMRLIREHFMIHGNLKLGEGKEKEGSHGQLADTRALKAHRAGATGMEREWNVQDGRSRVDVERRVGASRKCIHSSLFAPAIFLHPLSPLYLFADTPAPIGNGAFGLDAAQYR